MIAAWIARLWTKAGAWVALAGAVIVAVLGALLWGEHKGKQAGVADAARQAVKDAAAATKAVQDAAATRTQVDAAADKLPDAPAQEVGNAAPDTAAGKLRDDGWTRD